MNAGEYFFYLLIALVALTLVGGVLVMLGHHSELVGRRETAGGPWNATLHSSYLGVVPLATTELVDLRAAKLQSGDELPKSKGSLIKTYRLRLVTGSGEISMNHFLYTGREWHEALRDRINSSLADPNATSFSVQSFNGGWWAYVSAAAVVLLPVCVAAWLARGLTKRVEFWPDEEVLTQ